MKNIFFIHGFWVRKDARGMFPDIQRYISQNIGVYNFFYTDLNDFSEDGKDTFLKPLSKQAKIMSRTIEKNTHKQGQNIIISHSQWCVVASLLDLENVSKIIFLAPPTNNDLEITIQNFQAREGTKINKEWMSILVRSDWNKTFVPEEYWQERSEYSYKRLYKNMKRVFSVSVIFAAQDEILKNDALENIEWFDIHTISWNHNFDGVDRKYLVEYIWKILQ